MRKTAEKWYHEEVAEFEKEKKKLLSEKKLQANHIKKTEEKCG